MYNNSMFQRDNHSASLLNQSNDDQQCLFLTFNTKKIDQVKSVYIVTATMDAILILPTIVLNVLLIVSLYRSSEIRKPSTKLLFSLAMSDLLVGLVVEPAFLIKKVAEFTHNFSMYCKMAMVTYIAGIGLSAVSFLNLTAIAVDRYFVVHRGTKYRTMVTNNRVAVVVAVIWGGTLCLAFVQLFTRRSTHFKVVALITIVCMIITSMCYIRCFITLKQQQCKSAKLFESSHQRLPTNCSYKKSIYTMFYVYLAFGICYLPLFGSLVSALIVSRETAATWAVESLSTVVVYLNSLVNPILLLWRMRNLRAAFVRTISTKNLNQLVTRETDINVNRI